MSIASTYTFESLAEDQSDELFAIYKKFFPPLGWSGAYFRWQYYENPSGAAKVWVARESGKIVASYIAIPHRVYANGRVGIGWRVQNVVTLAEHRGQGLYHKLAALAAQELFTGDHPLNFTFPNERSKNGFIRTGWKAAFRLPLKTKALRDSPPSANLSAVVKPLTRFDADSESIWEAYRNRLGFAVERSSSYLNWRYFSNPKSEYSSFRLDSRTNAAIMIVKFYAREDGTRCSHLCDLFQSEPDSALTESAFKQWIDLSVGRECREISCWCVTGSSLEPILSKAGFTEKEGFDRWMVLNANTSALEKAKAGRYDQESSWHLVMGDSDVY
jgi:hypothetical protein